MNKHLEPVFSLILPELEQAGIEYWAFGGIGVAALAREFIRKNNDVDIFVKEKDFEKTKSILYGLCKKYNDFQMMPPMEQNPKQKIDISKDKSKIFSVIPVFFKNDLIEFRYPEKYGGNEVYSTEILKRVERNISGYRFFTSLNRFIIQKFFKHLAVRPEKLRRLPVRKDVEAILKFGESAGKDELPNK
jgi:hypothetical protein